MLEEVVKHVRTRAHDPDRGSGLRLPDFIGVGPPRTATTWLHEALKGHAGLPRAIKETNFFLWQYDKGLDWYASMFRDSSPRVPIGEFSAFYFVPPPALERISMHIPNCRIIITLRDPVERLYSHYRKGCEEGYFSGSFEQVIEGRPDLLDWSRYARHVQRWHSAFGQAKVLVLIYEDLKTDPQKFLDRVTDFIGIESIPIATVPSALERVNSVPRMPRSHRLAILARKARDRIERRGALGMIRLARRARLRSILFSGGPSFPPIQPETEARLRRAFEPEVEKVEELMGIRLPQWSGSSNSA